MEQEKSPAYLGSSEWLEKTRDANREHWVSPIGRHEFDPQGDYSFTVFECRDTVV